METKRNNRNRATRTNTSNRKANKGTGKIAYFPGLHNRPVIEKAEQGVPLTLELCTDIANDDTPTLVDREYYGTAYIVDDEKTYTLRLGIHSSGLGIAAMDMDTAVACVIPGMPDKEQYIMGLFFIDELYPAKYMDSVWFKARENQSFRIEYVFGSAVLETSHDSCSLPLSNDSVKVKDDMVIIYQDGVRDKIPNCCTFFFDFLRIQIKVIYE